MFDSVSGATVVRAEFRLLPKYIMKRITRLLWYKSPVSPRAIEVNTGIDPFLESQGVKVVKADGTEASSME